MIYLAIAVVVIVAFVLTIITLGMAAASGNADRVNDIEAARLQAENDEQQAAASAAWISAEYGERSE